MAGLMSSLSSLSRRLSISSCLTRASRPLTLVCNSRKVDASTNPLSRSRFTVSCWSNVSSTEDSPQLVTERLFGISSLLSIGLVGFEDVVEWSRFRECRRKEDNLCRLVTGVTLDLETRSISSNESTDRIMCDRSVPDGDIGDSLKWGENSSSGDRSLGATGQLLRLLSRNGACRCGCSICIVFSRGANTRRKSAMPRKVASWLPPQRRMKTPSRTFLASSTFFPISSWSSARRTSFLVSCACAGAMQSVWVLKRVSMHNFFHPAMMSPLNCVTHHRARV